MEYCQSATEGEEWLEEDDEEESDNNKILMKRREEQKEVQSSVLQEEEDPLDAFMRTLDESAHSKKRPIEDEEVFSQDAVDDRADVFTHLSGRREQKSKGSNEDDSEDDSNVDLSADHISELKSLHPQRKTHKAEVTKMTVESDEEEPSEVVSHTALCQNHITCFCR